MKLFETPDITADNINFTYDNSTNRMGWVCPKCGAALSPDVKCCPYCNNMEGAVDIGKEHMICD